MATEGAPAMLRTLPSRGHECDRRLAHDRRDRNDDTLVLLLVVRLVSGLSEAGNQSVQTFSVFQDIGQARRRQASDAEGLMSLSCPVNTCD
jgi:hypothetical protein